MLKEISFSLIVAGLMIAVAAGLKFANSLELIDQETVKRGAQMMFGLMLAGYANVMPKQLKGPIRSTEAARRSLAAVRFGGWSFTLAGLGYAATWAFAPISVADEVATGMVALAMVIVLSYAGRTLLACRRARQSPLNV
jgi:hypothetical protein